MNPLPLASSPEEPTVYPILVVDDEPQIYDVLHQIARVEFPQAHLVSSLSYDAAVSYLKAATGWLPRLIILDVDLKGDKSGLDLLNWIRASERYALMPVVMLSVVHDEAIVREAYARGANIFTNKPFTLPEWKEYVHFLHTYWFNLAATPKLWVEQTVTPGS